MTSEGPYSLVASKGSLMNEAAFPPLPSSQAQVPPPLHQPPSQPGAPHLQLLQQLQQPPPPPQKAQLGHIVLSNVPVDISPREAAAVFLLVYDDVQSVEVSDDHKVHAWFKSPTTAATAARMLDGRAIFGSSIGAVRAEYDGSTAGVGLSSMLGSLRLSNSGMSNSGMPPLSIQTNQQPQQFGPESSSAALGGPPSLGHGFDAFPKRLSVGNQRSRFLFSDPFTAGAPASASGAPGPSIDLSDITGKSLLLMESQSDAREYDSLVRDPWLASVGNLPASSAPQTPGMSSSFDWSSNPTSSDRRRTSSAFFSGSKNIHPNLSNGVLPIMQGLPSQFMDNQTSQGQPPQSQGQDQSASQPPGPASQPPKSQGMNAPQPQTSAGGQSAHSSSQPNQRQPAASTLSTTATPTSQPQAQSGQSLPPASAQGAAQSGLGRKDVPDLSLLARVPPPANPADQNPPCNTLYVGNLPPDATEAELRALFLPQKGFRRLSFRTKNQSSAGPSSATSHNHGPMCFVEFEDVAHATRALAELYGRALPRPNGSNGKGGIRLSFSKNPLGVRGPGNPRRSSANQVPGTGTSSTNANGVSYGFQYQK